MVAHWSRKPAHREGIGVRISYPPPNFEPGCSWESRIGLILATDLAWGTDDKSDRCDRLRTPQRIMSPCEHNSDND